MFFESKGMNYLIGWDMNGVYRTWIMSAFKRLFFLAFVSEPEWNEWNHVTLSIGEFISRSLKLFHFQIICRYSSLGILFVFFLLIISLALRLNFSSVSLESCV